MEPKVPRFCARWATVCWVIYTRWCSNSHWCLCYSCSYYDSIQHKSSSSSNPPVSFFSLFSHLLASVRCAPTLQISQEKRGRHCRGPLAICTKKSPRKWCLGMICMKFVSYLQCHIKWSHQISVGVRGRMRSIKQLIWSFSVECSYISC